MGVYCHNRKLRTARRKFFYVVGTSGIIRRTTNYVGTWTFIPSGTTLQLNSIIFADINTGNIVGNGGKILQTTNGGLNWSNQSSPIALNHKSISIINSTTGWALGQNGIILRTGIPVGLQNYGSDVPIKFRLYQNFPNPFNPVTKINYELPRTSKVNIVIYDIVGREVKRLVKNEIKETGRYTVEFDGQNYASGVYFYRIEVSQAGSSTVDFVQNKKMVY